MVTEAQVREKAVEATLKIIEVALQKLCHRERIEVLSEAWDRTVKPKLRRDAERQKLKAFGVPFPVDVD